MSFPRYPKYKDSGVEWLGEVPEHWVVTKTARYFKIAMGQTILNEDLVDDGEWPVFSATDGDHYFGRINDPRVRLGIGDIVIPARGNSIGAVKIVKEPSTTTQTTIYCKNLSSSSLDPQYVFHFLRGCRSNLFYFTQTAIPQITVEEVGSNPILIPPHPEQTFIAAFLDSETAKIDALVAEQRRLMELLKEKRQAVISHAVTKGLNPHAPMKPSGIEWLGDVPEHWEIHRVKSVTKFITSGPRGWSERLGEVGSIFVQSGDLDDSLSVNFETAKRVRVEDDAESSRTRLLDGDIVVCVTGAKTGNVAVCDYIPEPAYVNQHLCLVRSDERVHSKFLGALLKSEIGQTYFALSQYGLKQGLSLEDVKDAPVLLPPATEQFEIVDHVDSLRLQFDTLTAEAQRAIDLLQERRTALISAAVTGQIDVRGLAESEAA